MDVKHLINIKMNLMHLLIGLWGKVNKYQNGNMYYLNMYHIWKVQWDGFNESVVKGVGECGECLFFCVPRIIYIFNIIHTGEFYFLKTQDTHVFIFYFFFIFQFSIIFQFLFFIFLLIYLHIIIHTHIYISKVQARHYIYVLSLLYFFTIFL